MHASCPGGGARSARKAVPEVTLKVNGHCPRRHTSPTDAGRGVMTIRQAPTATPLVCAPSAVSAAPLPPPNEVSTATAAVGTSPGGRASPPPLARASVPPPPSLPGAEPEPATVSDGGALTIETKESAPFGVYDMTAAAEAEALPARAPSAVPPHPATVLPPAAARPVPVQPPPGVEVHRLMALAESRARACRAAGIDPYTSYRPMVRKLFCW